MGDELAMKIIDLTDKRIVITGAASGIGRATAIVAAREGAKVSLVDINAEGISETHSKLYGEGHSEYVADLSAPSSLEGVVDRIVGDYGNVNGIVHCAGISSRRPIGVIKQEPFNKLMQINFYSFVELVRLFSKRGRLADGGSVVVMSSISSLRGFKAKTEYCASKAAVDAFVRCAALELAGRGIRVNSVMPAEVLTPMALRARSINDTVNAADFVAPLGPSTPQEVANTIAFLLSDATKTISGTSIRIDGCACV